MMTDQATEHTRIAASPERCLAVALDIERYPEWARDIKEATVVDRDAEGRPVRVAYRAAAMGHSARYTLRYDHEGDRLGWELVRGDIMRRLDGSYVLQPAADAARTLVTYHLAVELIVPLPGFVKRRAEQKIVHTALRELRAHVERR